MTVISSYGSSWQQPSDPNSVPPRQNLVVANPNLINGTQNLAVLPTPNDGQKHTVTCTLSLKVTSAETGGQIVINYTNNGNVMTTVLSAGGAGVGNTGISTVVTADPNTNVVVQQSSALTIGAAQAFLTLSTS